MEYPLHESHVLSLLNSLVADPLASVGYEYLSGGLVWSDELPLDEVEKRAVLRSRGFKYVLAYRASMTIGEERREFRPQWEQVEQYVPNWPGLKPERRGNEARRELAARKDDLFREDDVGK